MHRVKVVQVIRQIMCWARYSFLVISLPIRPQRIISVCPIKIPIWDTANVAVVESAILCNSNSLLFRFHYDYPLFANSKCKPKLTQI